MDAQGHSPFVWSVIGGIAQATERLRLGTGVTCPMIRTHPAIIAHAAATCGAMMPGRFFLGLGTSENLNEHILGDHWPAPDERLEMLEEAIVQRYEEAGGSGPRYGQVTVCWAETEEEARKIAFEIWPNAGINGDLSQELPLPRHFEQAAQMVTEDGVAELVACGPDPERHHVHQVGPDQEGFLRFYGREILPKL